MIERLRVLCEADERVAAALLYGSFATGEADQYSDIECALFFEDESFPNLDKRAWIEQIAPVLLFFADDFGHYTAIFDNLIRGEFHFEPRAHLSKISGWQGNAWFPSVESALLVDRTGDVSQLLQPMIGRPPERDAAQTAQRLADNFINLILLGLNTLERGELARALEILSLIHRYLIWLARSIEHSTMHWPTPSRSLEQDISAESYDELYICTARLDRNEIVSAYKAAWVWGVEMIAILSQRHSMPMPSALLNKISVCCFGN